MTDRRTVGVIIPVFNRSSVVAEGIQSVLDQTRPVDQIVVVDDGSTDDSAAVVSEMSEADDRITLIVQANAGPSAARNTALRNLETELVTFLDSDDLMVRHRVDFQVGYLASNPEADGVYGGSHIAEPAPGIDAPKIIKYEAERDWAAYAHSLMIPTEHVRAIGGYNEDLRIGEDNELMVRLKSSGRTLAEVEEVLTIRRVFGDNLSYANDLSQSFFFGAIRSHIESRHRSSSE